MVNSKSIQARILETLEREPGLSVKKFAEKLRLNRIYLSGFLDALELQGLVRSKRIGPARAYFPVKSAAKEMEE
jgi:predicted transcriptional regulator